MLNISNISTTHLKYKTSKTSNILFQPLFGMADRLDFFSRKFAINYLATSFIYPNSMRNDYKYRLANLYGRSMGVLILKSYK